LAKEFDVAMQAVARPPAVLVFRYWLPVFAYLGVVQILGAQPDLQVPMLFPNVDKVVHVLEYLGLGVLLARACRASIKLPVPIGTALFAVGVGLCIGAADEFIQSFVPGRMSSVNDLLADATGLLIAQCVYLLVVRE
jgi:VanZ family protein